MTIKSDIQVGLLMTKSQSEKDGHNSKYDPKQLIQKKKKSVFIIKLLVEKYLLVTHNSLNEESLKVKFRCCISTFSIY